MVDLLWAGTIEDKVTKQQLYGRCSSTCLRQVLFYVACTMMVGMGGGGKIGCRIFSGETSWKEAT
jgi:hypothetical protein